MLKKKLGIIILLMIIVLSVLVPAVKAADAETVEPETTTIDTTQEDTSGIPEGQVPVTDTTDNSEVSDDTFKKSDIYLTGDKVVVDYTIDGNLFVIANEVTIDAQIGGDAFIIARKVTVTNQGYVFSNLFTVTGELDIQGVVYDVYATADKVTVSGYVYRDIRVGTNTLDLVGMVGRNAYVNATTINFDTKVDSEGEQVVASHGIINGDFNYTAKEEIQIPEGYVVGNANYQAPTAGQSSNTIMFYVRSLLTSIITTVVIFLLCLWLAPKFLEKTNKLVNNKIWPVIGLGILTSIVLLFATVILIIAMVTANIAILAMYILILLFLFANAIFTITVNNFICEKLKMEKTLIKIAMLVATSLVLWLLQLIPYVSILVYIVSFIIGTGIIISSLVLKNLDKKEKTPKATKTEKTSK